MAHYTIRINGVTHTIPVPETGDDPAEIHILDAKRTMVAAVDLFDQSVNLLRFGPDGEVAESLAAPTNHG